MPEVKGVPPGLTAEPLDQHSGSVRGVPEGLFAEPLTAGATKEAIAAVPKLDPFKKAQRTKADADPAKSPELKPAPQAQVKGVPPELTAHPVSQVGTLRAAKPLSPFQELEISARRLPDVRTAENSLDELGRMWKHANMELSNPGAMTDQEWAERQKAQTAFFEKHLGQGPAKLAEGVTELGESFTSPYQILLMAGTLGESGLVQAAQKIGVPYAVPAAKTLAKLAQLQFSTQMIEGTATAAENAARAAWNGDWWGAATGAVEGIVSGVMAKGLVSHEMASERVHRDLNATTTQMPQHAGKTFDQLNSYEQGVVIDQTVKNNPDYKALLAQADEQQEKGKDDSKKQRHARLKRYYSTAVEKAWQPDAAQRTIDGIQRAGEEDERHEGIQKVVATLRTATEKRAKAVQDENDARLSAAREDRPERRQAAAGTRSERQKLADEVKAKREGIYAERQQAQQAPSDIAQRQVETAQAEDGTVTYPANYWGEENSFGVTGDLTGHGVYRQTARGVEWLDRSGNFVEEPADVFTHPDPATADTIARLSSLSATADTLADAEGATSEQKADAEKLASIRRDLLSGEIDAREAQKQAGIAEKVTVSDAHTAARDGQLTGPFHESSPREFEEKLEGSIRSAAESGETGWEEEDIRSVLDQSAALARQQTENNLHHVYRPGDHIVSKRGVKWTLDAKGMLHPDDGGPAVPLQRDGLYSNQAIQLAETGRIGYGTQTRDERRAAFAKNREVQASIRERQADVDREMRMAQQAQGLQLVDAMEPRTDAGEKAVRERRRMTRPPRPAESTESKIVRMIFQAPSDASSVIQSIARAKDVSPEEVMRQSLATDPAMSGTVEQKVAGLEPGDRIVEPIRKKPWVVEMGKDGETYLRSGNAQPVKLDRLNPSADVKGIIARGEIEKDIEPQDVQTVAFENPHYVRWQDEMVAQVEDLVEKPAPEPRTVKQVEVQIKATRRRADAAMSVATKALIEAVNDPKPVPVEQAGEQVQAAQEKVKTAEEAYAQSVEAESKAIDPRDEFPPKAPISIAGLKGNGGIVRQNGREIPIHYELVPIDALTSSHGWNGKKMPVNPDYDHDLQPRPINDDEAAENALRAERGTYDFREYADKTINGAMGPAIVEPGGRVVGGNTRIAIMRRHLDILRAAPDDVGVRAALLAEFHEGMRQLAMDSGIHRYPPDGHTYVVVRMMDEPIETKREASELGRLFNKKIGVEINKAAMGVSYSRALDHDILREIGRKVDAHDTMAKAVEADPAFFNKIVMERFDVGPQEYANWFDTVGSNEEKRKVLSKDGRDQFEKAVLGVFIKDTSILHKLQGKTPYMALQRSLSYMVKLLGLPDMNITGKIAEAMRAAADTEDVDRGRAMNNDEWYATYKPSQVDAFDVGDEGVVAATTPPMPDRMVETIWRALQAGNRTLNDRLKSYISDETSTGNIDMFEATPKLKAADELPVEAFNRSFRREINGVEHLRKDGVKEITADQFEAAVKGLPLENIQPAEEGVKEPEQAGGQETAPPTKYKFGNTQAGIPAGSAAAKGLAAARSAIAKGDLAGDGLEEDPHVTLRYGIQGEDTDRIREFLERQQPFDATLGKTDIFPPSANSDGAGVVVAPIESAELHRLNTEIERHGDFKASDFPDYKPHATIAYVKPEAAEKYRGMAETEGQRFRIASIDISKRDGSKETVQLKGKLGKIERPPKGRDAAQVAAANLADMKSKKGYVTPEELKTFLDTNPATKEHAPELYRTAKLMAEYVYDADPPVGVDRKEALDWVLRERLAGFESGELKSARGMYSDPIEKGMGDGILRLHKAADPTTFIHEFAHVIFPLLSDDDMRAIATIKGQRSDAEWDGQRSTLKGEVYKGMSERLAHGMEQFLRDENPTGFTHEVKTVLAKIKDVMRKVYLAFKTDPLSDYVNTEESRGVFAKMFGIADFDVADEWRAEKKKALAEEKRLKRPSEEKHPLVKMASEMGAAGIKNTIAGKVEDTIGNRVHPINSAVLAFVSKDAQMAAWSILPTPKIANAELVDGDGEWGIRFNTPAKLPPHILEQSLPERHPGIELDDMEKRLKATPTFKIMERKFLQVRIDNLKNRIRAERGVEPLEEKTEPGLAKAVGEEVKRGRTDGVRKTADGVPADSQPKGIGKVPERRVMGLPGHAAAGGKGRGPARESVARVPASLADVTPVNLQPLAKERGVPRGTIEGQAFDQKAWADGLKAAGLPENTPPPTYALDPKTAQVLKYPGQKQIVQVVMSALDQGDGAVVASATGTGKTYTAMATVKEFRSMNPEAKILHITKNRGLLKDAAKVAADSFGMELDRDVPDSPEVEAGVYGTTYIGMLNNKGYSKIPWDLVIADESGEARNYFRDENKQGKALIDVIENSKKAMYFSATPFHSPMEYGYLTKLNLWPKGQFDKWIQDNFAHEKIGDKIVARLDPGKQAKLRQQLIDRGQLVSQTISYEGFNAHFGVVPVTDGMKRSLDRIREGFARARDQFVKMGKKGMAEKAAAFEATYTKAFLERERIPQAIDLAKKARAQGWHIMVFSETSAEDLFRRERSADIEPSTYQQLDDAMGGTLSKIIPPFEDVYDRLREEFGSDIVDYSGRGNTMASRDAAKSDFLTGKAPMLYTTYAAGGIGVSLHDADYPDLNVKGGDKPRVAIYLGPPYSGVLLEQAMGRPWRFGTKSDVHAVFLATDSEPDIHLMQTKVGPRMKALRAAVHGERDSLASVMQSYTDDQKTRERQDMLAYQEGNEMKVSAANFQVRSKGRDVGIHEWSQINFPSARDAMNKGMKYGEQVEGSDWSNLFQKGVPDRPEDARAREAVDRMAKEALTGKQPLLGGLDPADRQTVTALATAGAYTEIGIPTERDKDNAGRQSMEASVRENAMIPYHGIMLSQEQGMLNIARMEGKHEVGYELRRMNRSYRADYDINLAQFWNLLEDAAKGKTDDATMRELWDVVEGKKTSSDPAIMTLGADVADMMAIAHDELATAGVKVKTKGGTEQIPYADFPRDPHYMPHRIDWDYEMVDPETKEKIKVRDFLKKDEKTQKRILDSIPELKAYSQKQVLDYLRRNDPRAPRQTNIHYAREVNFPFIKKDYGTLLGYFDQAAQAIAAAKNFGPEEELLNRQIDKIHDVRGNSTLKGMFRAALQPQDWGGITGKLYNAAIAYEAASKMTFSAFKVPFHLVLGPAALKGRVMPHIRAFSRFALHPKEVMERATFAGAVVRQSSTSEMLFGERMNSPVRQILRKEMFEGAYKMVRVISGEAARVYMDQYAIRDLKKGGTKAEHARRMLKEVFLVGDHGIDEAIRNGRFGDEDVLKGQTAFTNMAAFSGDPMQMPGMARMEMTITDPRAVSAMKRAVRLTYALQSFSVKAMSLMREHLWDEVMVHGNKKPLMYALIAFPAIGTLLNLTGTGVKHGVKKGLEGAADKAAKMLGRQPAPRKDEKDSWDNYLTTLEDDVEHPEAVKFLKWYIDSWALSAGAELFKTLGDPLMNIASGKPAKADLYWAGDVMEHAAGPFFTDLYKTIFDEPTNLQKIHAGKTHPEQKPAKYRKSILKYATEEVPALREVPWVADALKKPEKNPFYRK